MIASMALTLNLHQQSEDKTDKQQENLDSQDSYRSYRFFVYFDFDSPSRDKYYRTSTAKYTIEQVLFFFK
jgi:hypothetical protein